MVVSGARSTPSGLTPSGRCPHGVGRLEDKSRRAPADLSRLRWPFSVLRHARGLGKQTGRAWAGPTTLLRQRRRRDGPLRTCCCRRGVLRGVRAREHAQAPASCTGPCAAQVGKGRGAWLASWQAWRGHRGVVLSVGRARAAGSPTPQLGQALAAVLAGQWAAHAAGHAQRQRTLLTTVTAAATASSGGVAALPPAARPAPSSAAPRQLPRTRGGRPGQARARAAGPPSQKPGRICHNSTNKYEQHHLKRRPAPSFRQQQAV
jgi:hypothetical protein